MEEFKITTPYPVRAGDIAAMVAHELGLRHQALVGILTQEPQPRPVVYIKRSIKDLSPIAEVHYKGGALTDGSQAIVDGRGTQFILTGDAMTQDIYEMIRDSM